MTFVKGHKHSENWKKAVSKPRPESVRVAVSKAQKGRKHTAQEGFQKGHAPIAGTERTRFYKGQPSWNKGKGTGRDPIKPKYNAYKSNAKKRGLLFTINLSEFKVFLSLPCVYCGSASSGIDRVDNTQGYTDGNMAPCCEICNHMKWNLTKDDFLAKCKEIVGYEI